jgi:subtilase family serine protease
MTVMHVRSFSRPGAIALVALFGFVALAMAEQPTRRLIAPIDETQRVALGGNTPSPARDLRNDRGVVADALPLEHLRLVLQRSRASEAALEQRIDAMHDPKSPLFHQWLTPDQLGAQYGVAPEDRTAVTRWLESHGFTVNLDYRNGFVIDFSGNAGQVREAFHTEIHTLKLPNGEQHISNMKDPEIPAALSSVIAGVATLHDFRPHPHVKGVGKVAYDAKEQRWKPTADAVSKPHFNVNDQGTTFNTVGPYDFATIYDLLPLWKRGFTGKGITIAAIEDTNMLHPSDWNTFRSTFGMTGFKDGNFTQVYPQAKGQPTCTNPGQNGDEIEAALDVEWASASAPDANVELVACANTNTTSGLDTAILNLLDTHSPDIITDSYGLCETITGAAEIKLENYEEQQAAAQGVTFFIAQGDTGADECLPVETAVYAEWGINSGDNTASSYVVDVGGTDFMAQYNEDTHGIPLSRYWSSKNTPGTLQSALSYIPEIPWNDSCTSVLIYSDPVNGGYREPYGKSGFCNSALGQQYYQEAVSGSGGPSTCFTGTPLYSGVVGGSCKGNPKPSYQTGVPGIPSDGLRDQPDISFFAANGIWGAFYVECLSDTAQGGAPCTPQNDAILLGGGGTSFSAPAMAGIQALVDQQYGKQGNANYALYALAAKQFKDTPAGACSVSNTNGNLPSSSCIFHDVTLGDMDTPCGPDGNGNFHDCYGAANPPSNPTLGVLSLSNSKDQPAWPATVGYDLATGLGSLDATNLFNAWAQWSKK